MPLLTPKERTPPKSAGNNARRALEVRASKPASERCCQREGLIRARQLMSGEPLSESVIKRMKAFFDRHERNAKAGETWGDKGKGWQSYHAWGGDSGKRWAASRVAIMERRKKQK